MKQNVVNLRHELLTKTKRRQKRLKRQAILGWNPRLAWYIPIPIFIIKNVSYLHHQTHYFIGLTRRLGRAMLMVCQFVEKLPSAWAREVLGVDLVTGEGPFRGTCNNHNGKILYWPNQQISKQIFSWRNAQIVNLRLESHGQDPTKPKEGVKIGVWKHADYNIVR